MIMHLAKFKERHSVSLDAGRLAVLLLLRLCHCWPCHSRFCNAQTHNSTPSQNNNSKPPYQNPTPKPYSPKGRGVLHDHDQDDVHRRERQCWGGGTRVCSELLAKTYRVRTQCLVHESLLPLVSVIQPFWTYCSYRLTCCSRLFPLLSLSDCRCEHSHVTSTVTVIHAAIRSLKPRPLKILIKP